MIPMGRDVDRIECVTDIRAESTRGHQIFSFELGI